MYLAMSALAAERMKCVQAVARLDIEHTRLEFYDSMPNGTGEKRAREVLQAVGRWFNDVRDQGGAQARRDNAQEWEMRLFPPGTPRQENGHDCGVFAAASIHSLAHGRGFQHTQSSMQALRQSYTVKLWSLQP